LLVVAVGEREGVEPKFVAYTGFDRILRLPVPMGIACCNTSMRPKNGFGGNPFFVF
jgi:hypothetical protein